MFTGSPKKVALGRITMVITISIVSGMFFIQGFAGALRGDAASWVQFMCSPILLAVAILHGRKLWQSIS
jgi:hypothetical protein